ncbi:TrmH family RNA methyltransferase [Embleya sp. NPDC008237]|uniref:TrmH family RNA methyltransferase n=1 Tax=Embleya sp. NPDC008237 TaxID=3363978 RepID=UPI0036EA658C
MFPRKRVTPASAPASGSRSIRACSRGRNAAPFAVFGVELADDAVRLADLEPARCPTIAVLGHESDGIPSEAFPHLDEMVEIPMIGTGTSLDVAVAGSLVAYKLAGLLRRRVLCSVPWCVYERRWAA